MSGSKGKSYGALTLLGAVLVIAIVVSLVLGDREAIALSHVPLKERLALEIDGWKGEDLPLGSTEALKAATQLLNYDDYVYRVYKRGQQEVFVYAMYWKQGSISIREIAGHTPDGCWIANGAQFAGVKDARTLVIGNRPTVAAEAREFMFGGQQPVVATWWHFWGNDLVDRSFDQKALAPTLKELGTWLIKRRGQRQDQLLVRLHAPGRSFSFVDEAPVREFVKLFPQVFTATPI